jgi:hypothetical protein
MAVVKFLGCIGISGGVAIGRRADWESCETMDVFEGVVISESSGFPELLAGRITCAAGSASAIGVVVTGVVGAVVSPVIATRPLKESNVVGYGRAIEEVVGGYEGGPLGAILV